MITISCSMSLKNYLSEYLKNSNYYTPDINWEWKSKEELMKNHKKKILKSNQVLVLHDWKLGDSVREEIEFALLNWIPIFSKDIRK